LFKKKGDQNKQDQAKSVQMQKLLLDGIDFIDSEP
jgi:hypothetical protein